MIKEKSYVSWMAKGRSLWEFIGGYNQKINTFILVTHKHSYINIHKKMRMAEIKRGREREGERCAPAVATSK